MVKKFLCIWVVVMAMTLSFCTTTKKAASGPVAGDAMISYQDDIAPLLGQSCSPCHFPDGGKVKFLDTHGAVSKSIDDIIQRVELPVEADGFMPFKSKKDPLTADQIQLLKDWRSSGMN